jgi:hypothetical protein
MALSLTIQQETGIEVQDAYVQVVSALVRKNQTATACYVTFADKEKPPFDSVEVTYPYDLDGHNPIKQAYLYLKTLPEFSDAVDC